MAMPTLSSNPNVLHETDETRNCVDDETSVSFLESVERCAEIINAVRVIT